MSEPLISIIIPVYKVEKYLEKCINSILSQTYQNCEIILIDDGSPDACPQICDLYAARYENITVYHKKNGGLSDARNYGVKRANSDWIVFVDSDDFVEPAYIEDLWKLLRRHNADMAMAGSIQADETGRTIGKKLHFDSFCVCGSDAIFEVYAGPHVRWNANNKLYPKRVLLQYPFQDGYFEDMGGMYRIVDAVGNVAIGDSNQNYKYVQHTGGSILNSALSSKHMHVFRVCKEFGSYIDEKYPELNVLKPVIYIHAVVQMLHRQHMSWNDYRKVFRMQRPLIRISLRRIIEDKRIPKKTKLFALLLSTNPWIYRACHLVSQIKKLSQSVTHSCQKAIFKLALGRYHRRIS